MANEKQGKIIQDLIIEAQRIKNGIIVVEFKIHEGDISLAEVISERKKLG